jgi:hypothetical protein
VIAVGAVGFRGGDPHSRISGIAIFYAYKSGLICDKRARIPPLRSG